jgi:hypothetical protein
LEFANSSNHFDTRSFEINLGGVSSFRTQVRKLFVKIDLKKQNQPLFNQKFKMAGKNWFIRPPDLPDETRAIRLELRDARFFLVQQTIVEKYVQNDHLIYQMTT